jgi:hypothetical protein
MRLLIGLEVSRVLLRYILTLGAWLQPTTVLVRRHPWRVKEVFRHDLAGKVGGFLGAFDIRILSCDLMGFNSISSLINFHS